MVNEQEEDKKKSDVFHLWVKLNIPKEEEEQGTDIVDQKIGFRNYKDLMMMNKNCNNTERVCHICHKVFGSGKALGGHMRIHVIQGANKKDDPILKNKLKLHRTITFKKEEGANPRRENVFDFPKKKEAKTKSTVTPKCSICGKEFPSMKSLFGHMRSHPEREWRGIHPPASASIAKNTSSSSFSSSLSEAEPPKTDKISPSAEINKAVDLAESLQGWAVTARRGRKAATTTESSSPEFSSSDDDQLLQAVTYLMMLSRGGENKNKMADRYCKSEILEVEKGGVVAAENVAVYNGESDDKLDGVKESCVVEHHHDHMETDFDKAVMIKNRRKRKKVKLCDLGSPKRANPMTPLMTCKTASSSPDKYKCSSCERSFTTHQALGGHMSSHNRSNNITIIHNNSIPEKNESIVCDEHPIINSQVDEETERRGSMSSNMVLEFDLNEAPPSSDGEAGFDPSVFCTW